MIPAARFVFNNGPLAHVTSSKPYGARTSLVSVDKGGKRKKN